MWNTNVKCSSTFQYLNHILPISYAQFFSLINPPCHHPLLHRHLGNEKQLLVFDFVHFKIARHVTVTVYDPTQFLLDPTNPYQRRQAIGRYQQTQASASDNWIVPGQKPARYDLMTDNLLTYVSLICNIGYWGDKVYYDILRHRISIYLCVVMYWAIQRTNILPIFLNQIASKPWVQCLCHFK